MSKDDEKIGESVSIETQKMMLSQFCKENWFGIFDYYEDDGFSGLSFQLPGFRNMMEDLGAGKIDTVITKNFSCLGRDYDASNRPAVVKFNETKYGYVHNLQGDVSCRVQWTIKAGRVPVSITLLGV